MSDLKHLVDTSIKMATASIIDAIRVYNITLPKDQYSVGYNEGLADAIRLVQLFQAKLDEPRQRLED
jgi:hypothetical protein